MFSSNSARWFNITCGLWLSLSAFSWPHTDMQFYNTWMVGASSVIFAAAAIRRPTLRYFNAALAVWLFVVTWMPPVTMRSTFWNNLVVSIVMFSFALTPNSKVGSDPGSADLTATH